MALSRLITDPRFPGKPDVSKKIRGLSIKPNQGDRYGVRLTTYYVVSSRLSRYSCRTDFHSVSLRTCTISNIMTRIHFGS